MSAGTERGVVAELQYDLKRLHETWMEIVYPRQRGAEDTVLGKWQPESGGALLAYRLWAILGVPVIGVVYPLVLFGSFLRFQTRRLDGLADRLGILGVVGISLVVWGILVAGAFVALDLATGGLTAIIAASLVATVCAGLAVGTNRVDGRGLTVALAYPFAMTAIFLPPVVAALFSETVAAVVLPSSTGLAQWLLDNLLDPIGIGPILSRQFELRGAAYAIMWVAISVPLGWLLGLLVTLADLARPTE